MKNNKKTLGKFELISRNPESAHLNLPTFPIERSSEIKVISIVPDYISKGCNGPEILFTIDDTNTIVSIEILY